ncbi:MAG TPA: hypothetical protein VFI13_11075, partial [Gemmatimonadales bacterium]|nr:hypothetical protein [Gemmatimonadales bacterium]
MMPRFRPALALTILAGLAPAALTAQDPDFTYHKALTAGQTVEIRGVNGIIDAQPASGGTLEVTAVKREHRHGDAADVTIQAVEWNGGVTICAVYPNPSRSRRENRCGHGDDYQMSTNENDVEVRFTVK